MFGVHFCFNAPLPLPCSSPGGQPLASLLPSALSRPGAVVKPVGPGRQEGSSNGKTSRHNVAQGGAGNTGQPGAGPVGARAWGRGGCRWDAELVGCRQTLRDYRVLSGEFKYTEHDRAAAIRPRTTGIELIQLSENKSYMHDR